MIMDKDALDRSTRRFSRRKRSRNCVFGRIFSSLDLELLISSNYSQSAKRIAHSDNKDKRKCDCLSPASLEFTENAEEVNLLLWQREPPEQNLIAATFLT